MESEQLSRVVLNPRRRSDEFFTSGRVCLRVCLCVCVNACVLGIQCERKRGSEVNQPEREREHPGGI